MGREVVGNRAAQHWGLIVEIIAKEGIAMEDQIRRICDIIDGDVSAEVIATDADKMLSQGRSLARIHKNVVVKVPLTRDGIRACSILHKEGIRVNVTLCFSAGQAILAAKAGAAYVSPFAGRIDDIGGNGMDLIRDIVLIYKNYGFKTQVLAASLRNTNHVIEAAKAGAHVATLPYKVLDALFAHPLTDRGLEQFLKDYAKVFQEVPA